MRLIEINTLPALPLKDGHKGSHSQEHDMHTQARRLSRWALAATAGALCLFANDNISFTQPTSLITQADARVGRPMTPRSVAGVARRTTRRAVVGGAVVGGAAATGYYRGYGNCYRDRYGALICP
jgi:hypothetical protein